MKMDHQKRKLYFSGLLARMHRCSTWDKLHRVCKDMDINCYQLIKTDLYPDGLHSKPVDDIANELLKKIPEADIQPGLIPIQTIGDGNCLYRSLSLIFFGTEDYHEEFRVRTIHEMVLKEDFYTKGTCVTQLQYAMENTFKYIENVSLDMSFKREIIKHTSLGKWCSLFHLMAVANFSDIPVCSIYPQTQNPGTNRRIMHQIIFPRGKKDSFQSTLDILWTNTTDMPPQGWKPNHFVPCIPPSLFTTERFVSFSQAYNISMIQILAAIFEPTCAYCMMGSYASLSVHPFVCLSLDNNSYPGK